MAKPASETFGLWPKSRASVDLLPGCVSNSGPCNVDAPEETVVENPRWLGCEVGTGTGVFTGRDGPSGPSRPFQRMGRTSGGCEKIEIACPAGTDVSPSVIVREVL